jgi:hypothetical protein
LDSGHLFVRCLLMACVGLSFEERADRFIRLRVGRTSRSIPVAFDACVRFLKRCVMGDTSERASAAWGETAPCLDLSGWLDDRRLSGRVENVPFNPAFFVF